MYMDFKEKYLKYKNKYLILKNIIKQKGGNQKIYNFVSSNMTEAFMESTEMNDSEIDYSYVPDAISETMLTLAINNSNYDICRRLLDSEKFDINTYDKNDKTHNTYFMNAIIKGNLHIINLFLNYGPDLKITNMWGYNVIILAANSPNVLRLLQSYRESLMDIETEPLTEFKMMDIDEKTDIIDVPESVKQLINSFITEPKLRFPDKSDLRGIRIKNMKINPEYANHLKQCVYQDYNSFDIGRLNIINPINNIIEKIKIYEGKILIVDGENVINTFNTNRGHFYESLDFNFYKINGKDYEFNILLLFFLYCKNNGYSNIIIVCKNDSAFKSLLKEFDSGIIKLRTWVNNIEKESVKINVSSIKTDFGISLDIIYVTASCTTNRDHPKDLKSYDDCLALGLLRAYLILRKNAYIYTRDIKMLYDYYIEKEILLPFKVTFNDTSFLFEPLLEPLFRNTEIWTQELQDYVNSRNIFLTEQNNITHINNIYKFYIDSIKTTLGLS